MNPNLTDLGVTFEPETHTYRLEDGREIPSVTHILRFMNVDISEFADRNARDRAAERGKRIHEACMIYDYEGEATVEPDIAPYLNSYAAFIADYCPTWEGIEVPVASVLLSGADGGFFAGTVDRFGMIDGERVVLDIKTGTSRAYSSYIAQAAAYSWALSHSNIRFKSDKIAYLILKPDGYTFKTFKRGEQEFVWGIEAFINCYRLNTIIKKGEHYGKRKRNDSL